MWDSMPVDYRCSCDMVRVTAHLIQFQYRTDAGIDDVESSAPLIPGALRHGMADQATLLRPPIRVVEVL